MNQARPTDIKMIPIHRINILNPRVRNKKVFAEIAGNIGQVGLKRPITVTPCCSGAEGKDYDLVCGQGRLEAFVASGQKEIPAIIINADQQQALVMSLVENLARRQHRALDLLQGIEALRKRGYDAKTISAKTGLTVEYVHAVLNLIERGEERLLNAVESGHMPISVAVNIAMSPGNEQQALQDAYENNQLRGAKLKLVQRLIESRRRRGKGLSRGSGIHGPRNRPEALSAKEVMRMYQQEMDRKRLMIRKAEATSTHLTFVTQALRRLLKEDHFNTILQAEGLNTLPQPLAEIINRG